MALGAASSWDNPDPALTEFLESMRDGVVVVGPDRRVKYLNASYYKHFALSPEEMSVGNDLYSAYILLARKGRLGPTGDRSPEDLAKERVMAWGGEETRIERRYLPDQRVLDIYRSQTTNGDVISICVDATDAEQTTRELAQQRTYMESLLENTTDAVTLIDRDGKFAMFNSRLLEFYEVDPDRVYWGMPYEELIREFGDLASLSAERRLEELNKRRAFAFDPTIITVRRPLANGRTLNINKTNLPGGGCVLTIRDITEEIAREDAVLAAQREAEESSRHKSEFVARMSHEMRTPLNGILGVAALMERGDLAERERDLVEVIMTSGRVLLRLIDDILDLSRLDAETFELVEEPVVIADVLAHCLDLVRPGATDAGLDLRFRGMPAEVPTLRGDVVRIKQILLNLLTNAVKFTECGFVELGFESVEGPEGITLTFAVKDSGVGISEEKLGQIFDRFFQIDGTVTRRHGGAGLGLSITRKLVDMMGGTIQVGSELGEGSIFTVRLTLQRCRREKPAKSSRDGPTPC